MASPPSFPRERPTLQPRPASEPPRYVRQPLGLPAGSVRALLAFMVLGLIWTLLLLPIDKADKVPLYLYYLMFLILGHFYAAHGHTIAGPSTGPKSPLYLPRGSIRLLIILGFVGVLGWRYYQHRDLNDLLKIKEPLLEQPYLPLVLVGTFFVGVFFSRVIGRMLAGPRGPSPWFQDIQAWVALMATLGLAVEFIIQLVINPSLDVDKRLDVHDAEMVLAGIVSFYLGARS